MNFSLQKENEGDRFSIEDDDSVEDEFSVKKSHKNKKKKTIVRSHPSTPVPSEKDDFDDQTFEMFSNPNKVHHHNEGDDVMSEALTDSVNDNDDYDETQMEERPSKGYETLDDEKSDLLYKLGKYSEKGIRVTKKYNINSNINEMRQEANRIKREIEVNSSIKFSRRMLMACVTGIEFMNKRYDPFDVHLDGWSESLMENIDDYDNVFEKLHDKYKSSVNVPPEMELLMSLAGSAFMFHLTNTMFKSIPNIGDMAKQNPDIMKTMMETMQAAAKQSSQQTQQTQQTQQPQQTNQQQESNKLQREMKKPSFDISNIMPPGMMLPLQVIPDVPKPIATNDNKPTLKIEEEIETNSIISPVSSLHSSIFSNNTKSVTINNTTKKRGRKSKKEMNDDNTITI